MIQILKKGKVSRYKVTCVACGCEFICDQADTWDSVYFGFRMVNCPCCDLPMAFVEEEARIPNDGTD